MLTCGHRATSKNRATSNGETGHFGTESSFSAPHHPQGSNARPALGFGRFGFSPWGRNSEHQVISWKCQTVISNAWHQVMWVYRQCPQEQQELKEEWWTVGHQNISLNSSTMLRTFSTSTGFWPTSMLHHTRWVDKHHHTWSAIIAQSNHQQSSTNISGPFPI